MVALARYFYVNIKIIPMKKLFLFLLAFVLAAPSFAAGACQMRYGTFNIRLIHPDDNAMGWGWASRRDRVADYVHQQDLDIVGMQEVLYPALCDLQERLPEYDYIGVGREDGKQAGEYSCIWYKRDRFEVLDKGNFWLSETPDSVGSRGWDAALERIASWGKFRDKKSGQIFMSVNTHFDHVGVEARKQSALLIIRKIREIVGDKPAIVTGDFNVDETSQAYKTITTNEFVLRDAFKVTPKHQGCMYTFQSFSRIDPKDCDKIDFIFLTPNIQVRQTTITPDNPAYILSDHNPHWADIEF